MTRKLIKWIAPVALGALVFAGIAGADHGGGLKTQAVSSTITATTIVAPKTATCVGADGTYEVSSATYTGTSTSADPRLNGPVQIRVFSKFNTTTKLGRLTGRLSIRGGGGSESAEGMLTAVNVNGQLTWWLTGHVHSSEARLFASFSSAFTRTGGFTSGQLGTGSLTGAGIVFSGSCHRQSDSKPKIESQTTKPSTHVETKGTIDQLSSGGITVKPRDGSSLVSCVITGSSPKVSEFKVGDRVEIECGLVAGQMVLQKIHRAH